MKKTNLTLMTSSFIGLTMLFGCNSRPNDKLEIEGKEYTISLGEINYHAKDSQLTVFVLADGKPLPNKIQHETKIVNILIEGHEQTIQTESSSPLVKMAVELEGYRIFPNEVVASEDGKFTLRAKGISDVIEVFTTDKTVCFNGKTKEIMSQEELNDLRAEWIRNNRAKLGKE